MAERTKLAAQVMGADAGHHADQAGRRVRQPSLDLPKRPFLAQGDCASPIDPTTWNEYLPISMPIVATVGCVLQGMAVLPSNQPLPASRYLERREHGRTSSARLAAIPAGESPANRGVQSLL
jgi:hypothetical protein